MESMIKLAEDTILPPKERIEWRLLAAKSYTDLNEAFKHYSIITSWITSDKASEIPIGYFLEALKKCADYYKSKNRYGDMCEQYCIGAKIYHTRGDTKKAIEYLNTGIVASYENGIYEKAISDLVTEYRGDLPNTIKLEDRIKLYVAAAKSHDGCGEKNIDKMLLLYGKATQLEDDTSCFELAKTYETGRTPFTRELNLSNDKNLKPDLLEAAKWYLKYLLLTIPKEENEKNKTKALLGIAEVKSFNVPDENKTLIADLIRKIATSEDQRTKITKDVIWKKDYAQLLKTLYLAVQSATDDTTTQNLDSWFS